MVPKRRWSLRHLAQQDKMVSPDLTPNEATFWRNVITGRRKIGALQLVGILLLCVAIGGLFFGIISTQWYVSRQQFGTTWDHIVASFGDSIVWLFVAVVLFLLGKFASR